MFHYNRIIIKMSIKLTLILLWRMHLLDPRLKFLQLYGSCIFPETVPLTKWTVYPFQILKLFKPQLFIKFTTFKGASAWSHGPKLLL